MATGDMVNTRYVVFTVVNNGRKPIHFVHMGFRYGPDEHVAFPRIEISPSVWYGIPSWVFVGENLPLGISETILRQYIAAAGQTTDAEAVYFADENGRLYDAELPDTVKRILYA